MQSLDEFYSVDSRRRGPELHLGVGWRSGDYVLFEYSLFWIQETRELCALRAPKRDVGPRGPFSNPLFAPVPLYHNIQPPKEKELGIEVLARLEEDEVKELLAGWEEHLADPAGFEWVKERVAEASQAQAPKRDD